MAVCLRLAAGGSVAGVGESALRALSKLDQVMPSRLRSQVVGGARRHRHARLEFVRLARRARRADDPGPRLSRPRTRVGVLRRPRGQRHRSGGSSRISSSRRESAGTCWRSTATARTGAACGWTVCTTCGRAAARSSPGRRPTPQRTCSGRSARRRTGMLHVSAIPPRKQVVAQHFSPSSVTIEADGPDACIVTAGADDPERMVFYFATVGADFEVLEPPEVADAVESVAERLRRAASRP